MGGKGSGHPNPNPATRFSKTNQPPPESKRRLPNVLARKKTIWTEERICEEADALLEWMENPKNFYMNQFATERGYPNVYLWNFAQKSEIFKHVYTIALNWQENKIAQLALGKKFDSAMSKMVLINNHGWKDKTETVTENTHSLKFILNDVDGATKDLVDEHRFSESSEGETSRPDVEAE